MKSKKRKPRSLPPATTTAPPPAPPDATNDAPPSWAEAAEAIEATKATEAIAVWKPWQRTTATILLLVYLLLLIIGPLSNPVSSQYLTAPVAETVAPLHRALFMGHGYRFFAPNPGDSHLVQYKITKSDGTQILGIFPDRDSIWPRLLYHRWFMLSETLFAEHAQTPSPAEFKKLNAEKRQRAKLLSMGGKQKLGKKLEQERVQEEAVYQKTLKRIKALVRATGEFLINRHDGQEIELSVATRTIPFPVEARQGAELDDEVFLRYPANAVIGRFTKSDFDLPWDTKTPPTPTGPTEPVDQTEQTKGAP